MGSTTAGQADGAAATSHDETERLRVTPDSQILSGGGDALVCPRCGREAAGDAYCGGCGLHLDAEEGLPTRSAFEAASPSAPPKFAGLSAKPVPTPGASPPRERKAVKVFVPIIGLVAIVAVGVAVISLVSNRLKSYAPLQAQIRHLQAQVASEQATISLIRSSSQAGAVSTLQNQMQAVQNQLQNYKVCVPELQQEINGLSVNTSNQNGWLTSAYLNNPTITSNNCNKALNGS